MAERRSHLRPPLADQTPPDQEARDLIGGYDIERGVTAELQRNMAIVAGAGSGKTSALVGRLLAHVLAGTPLEEIAAITFTRKAAGEMRARFASELQNLRDDLSTELSAPHPADVLRRLREERKRVDEALRHVDRCFIATIHSFCQELLRSAPAEASAAGLPPAFAVVDDWREEQLRKTFWRRYVASQLQTNETRLVELERIGMEPTDLEDFFGELCKVENLAVYAPDAPQPDLAAAVNTVAAFVETWQAKRPNPPLGTRDGLQTTLDRAQARMSAAGLNSPLGRIRFLSLFESKAAVGVTQNRWFAESTILQRDDAKALAHEHAPTLRQEVVLPVIEKWMAFIYEKLHAFCSPAVKEYAGFRKRQGKLAQQDLLLRTAELLRDPDVGQKARRRLGERYRFLLVDEFQDTDPVQAEVLFLLTAENDDLANERGIIDWRRARPRPGSLFVVGDDKQSIYRFRRADIQVFSEVCERLHPDDEPLRLSTNFRSESAICDWINDALAPVFSDDRAEEGGTNRQPPYELLRAFKVDERPNAARLRKLSVEKVSGDFATPIAEAEAVRIAEYIRYACSKGATAGDFLVLARVSKRLHVYASALEALGIPYAITGSKGLGKLTEVKAVIRLLDTILKPNDGPARLAFLTGPFCGISHAGLFRYTRIGAALTGSPPDEPPGALAEEDRAAFTQSWTLLRQAREWLNALPPSVALGRILESNGLLATAAQAEGGTMRAGSLLKLLALVRSLETDGLHWIDVLDELHRYEAGEQTMDEGSLESGSSSAVRIMTVHQAKGLQAPCVFLADPFERSPNRTVSAHVFRTEDGEPTVVLPYLKGFGKGRKVVAAPQNWSSHEEDTATFENEERRFAEAEAHRLLYVACTRAERLLVVSRYEPKSDDPRSIWGPLEPALEDIPELEQPPAFSEPAADEIDPVAFVLQLEAFDTEPRYTVRRPSQLHGDEPLRAVSGGLGVGFGSAVHALFEWTIARREEAYDEEITQRFTRQQLLENNAEPRLLRNALEAVRHLRASTLWSSLMTAEDVRTEVPFTAPDPNNHGDVITGRIDLAYLDADGWHLVDFKTDRIKDEAHKEQLKRHYQPQLEAYMTCWEALTGAPPTSATLWFAVHKEAENSA